MSRPADAAAPPPRHVRLFTASRWAVRRVQILFDVLHQGVCLGLIDPDGWQDIIDEHYEATRRRPTGDANYFDEAYNLRGFFPWEQEAYDAYFGACASVLVGAAGGGREVMAVAKRGVKVGAFECNAQLVGACQALVAAQGVDASVVLAEPNQVPESLGVYDGAILGWGAYIHVIGRRRRVALLESYRRHIKPGGPFLLSFFVLRPSRAKNIAYALGRAIRAIRFASPIEPGDAVATTFLHYSTEQEIREDLAEAGFDVPYYSEERIGHVVGLARSS